MYSQSPRSRSKNTPVTENLAVATRVQQATTPLVYPTSYTVTSSSSTDTINSSVSETMSDFVVENFWKGRALGYIFNNPMEHRIYEQSQSACNFDLVTTVYQGAYQTTDWTQHYNVSRVTSKNGSISFASCAAGAPSTNINYLELPDSLNVSSMQNRAVSTAFSNIGHDEILALASLKEAKTTVAGLIQTARKVVKVFRAVKHFDVQKVRGLLFQKSTLRRKKFKSIASQAEDVYMNARYNLRPLYYDMLGLLKLTVEQAYPRLTFRGEELDAATNSDSVIFNHTGTLHNGIGTRPVMRLDRVASRTVKVRAGVLTHIRDLSLSSRLGLDALAETAWDLIPFSFIADWFFDVGNTLLAWVPKPGIETLTSWVTVEAIDECINTIDLVSYDPGTGPPSPWVYAATGFNQTLSLTSPKKVWRYSDKYRLPNPSRPILPSIKINLDLLKLTDLFIIAKKMVSYSRI